MAQLKNPSKQGAKRTREPSQAVKYYLVAYNALSALGWSYVLITLLLHIFNLRPAAQLSSPTASSSLSRLVSQFTSSIPILKSSSTYIKNNGYAYVPQVLVPFVRRAGEAYGAVGVATAVVQTTAVLEIVHALVGWVSSPVGTTASQVASRLFAVWGVCEMYEVARTSPIYTTMILAWSLTESIRYPFYALSLLNHKPYTLLYLRYTTFYILYPLGAFSEAYLNYLTLPKSSPIPSLSSWAYGSVWLPYDYFRGSLLLVWPPALYVLYTYMIRQRRKTLGSAQKLGVKPKTS